MFFLFFWGTMKEGTVRQSIQEKITTRTHGARPACLCSPSTSHMEGVLPSEPCTQRRPRSDAATAFAAAHDSMAPHRMRHACSARFCKIVVSCRALALANCDTNDLVSADQRPPTSMASTTSLARDRGPTNSGCVRSLRLLAACSTTPSASAAAPCGDPSQWRAHTSVVSTAS